MDQLRFTDSPTKSRAAWSCVPPPTGNFIIG